MKDTQETQPELYSPQSRFCHKHGMEVIPFYSKKNDKWFWLHQVKDPVTSKFNACFVNSEEEDEAWQEKQFDYANDGRNFNDEKPREDVDIPLE